MGDNYELEKKTRSLQKIRGGGENRAERGNLGSGASTERAEEGRQEKGVQF